MKNTKVLNNKLRTDQINNILQDRENKKMEAIVMRRRPNIAPVQGHRPVSARMTFQLWFPISGHLAAGVQTVVSFSLDQAVLPPPNYPTPPRRLFEFTYPFSVWSTF